MVALVILAVFGLFRLSRLLLGRVMRYLKGRFPVLGADRMLVTAFMFLLSGLLFLPAFTSLFALFNSSMLTGGIVLHLFLVAISIILFSISEDLIRDFPSCELNDRWTTARHFRYISIPLIGFWAFGCIFLSPLFYSGLTVILSLFYLFALSCRPCRENGDKNKST
jgi:uncharacterized membrane protein